MYGYDPESRRQDEPGGCREVFVMTRIAFEVLLPPIAAILGVVFLFVAALFLLSVHPALALIPLIPVAGGVAWVIRRDRRLQREIEDEVRGGPP
jgi:hypothetical protein